MYVKELVSASTWQPNDKFDTTEPLVSILLPTFEKANNGFLKRVLNSIIAQTFKDFELIIVDDASSDETINIIHDYMRLDHRIHLIRHHKNIGLPAISEWEAYIKSRGKYIIFAFDDNYFYPDACANLVAAINNRIDVMCYGRVNLITKESVFALGTGSDKNIKIFNYIGNNAVILPREIINSVGLYDPHILMTRNCDWDLWQRIEQSFEMEFHDILIANEYGVSNELSLGNTYPIDSWGNYFWRTLDRNEKLLPCNFDAYNIFECPSNIDSITKQTISNLSHKHAIKRGWSNEKLDGLLLVLYDGFCTASVSHAFYFISSQVGLRVRLVNIHVSSVYELTRASAIIVMRGVDVYSDWIKAAKTMKIKMIYYTDDNFLVLSKNACAVSSSMYSSSLLKSETYDIFDEIWCSTPKLVEAYQIFLPHKKCFIHNHSYARLNYPLSIKQSNVSNAELVVGFIGGGHRLSSFKNEVFPEINKFSFENKTPIKLILAGLDIDQQAFFLKRANSNINIIFMPFELDWQILMRKFNEHGCKFIIHPSSDSENKQYKTDATLVCATFSGAVLCTDELDVFSDAILSNSCISITSWGDLLNVISTINEHYFSEILKNAKNLISNRPTPERLSNLLKELECVTWSDNEKRMLIISNNSINIDKISYLEEQINLKDALLDVRYKMIVDLQEEISNLIYRKIIFAFKKYSMGFLSLVKRVVYG